MLGFGLAGLAPLHDLSPALEIVRTHCDFITPANMKLVLDGTMTKLLRAAPG